MREDRRRALWVAVVTAVVLGFLAGWFARIWSTPSPESRARDRLEAIRERAHEATR